MNVGGFPGVGTRRRLPPKSPVNPNDQSTVFSILPKHIKETKCTMDIAVYEIGPGTPEKPNRLLIKPSSWWKDVDIDQPLIEIPVSSVVIAQSFVRDYSNGIVMCDMGESMPGLFFIPGDISVTALIKDYKNQLDAAIRKQNNWFTNLVKLGDSMWARANGNPLAISEDCRMAAKMLDIKDRPWAQDFKLEHSTACPACGTIRNSNFPVCANCKVVIDPKRFTELGLKFAS